MTIKSAQVSAHLDFSQLGTVGRANTPAYGDAFDVLATFAAGTGQGQCDIAYSAERTVTTGANDDIDLAGVLSDIFGVTIADAKIAALLIWNLQKDGTANTTTLTLSKPTNGIVGLFDSLVLQPGGFALLHGGGGSLATVTAATGDLLRVANSAGASNKYQIAMLGKSA